MTPSARVQRQIDALLDQTEEAIRERDWNAALECIRAVLNVDPTNEDAISFQGMAESARGDTPPSATSGAEQLAAPREKVASPDSPSSFANGRYEVTGSLGALPMGLQGYLIRDLLYSVREAGRPDLLMNAAGQTAGMLTKKRPAYR